MDERYGLLARDVLAHHLALTSTLLTIVAVSEIWFGKKWMPSSRWATRIGLVIALLALTILALAQSWSDEYNNVRTLIDEKSSLTLQANDLRRQLEFKPQSLVVQFPDGLRGTSNADKSLQVPPITQTGQTNIAQLGGKNNTATINPPVNPNLPTQSYLCDGQTRSAGPGPHAAMEVTLGGDTKDLQAMIVANNAHEVPALLSLCNTHIKEKPDWLTPYLFCSLGYSMQGDKTKAKELLNHFDQQKGPAYDAEPCKQMSDFLHNTLSPPERPAKAEMALPAPVRKLSAGDLDMEFISCQRRREKVVCGFRITNRGDSHEYMLLGQAYETVTRAFDTQGRMYNAEKVEMGDSSGGQYAHLILPPSVGVYCEATFAGISEEMKSFASLEIHFTSDWNDRPHGPKFAIPNVSIQ